MAIDAVVVGTGPNGLTAAAVLADAGLQVGMYEAAEAVGGGARTEELTLPGFHHDPCSAVHPLGAGSPAFREFPLERYGLEWVHPHHALAHPFPDGSAAVLTRSLDDTATSLEQDAAAYRRLVGPFARRWDAIAADVLRPQTTGPPRHPLLFAAFGLRAAQPVTLLARWFRSERTRALLVGLAGHTMAPLGAPLTGGVALLFAAAAHAGGWPSPRGGSQALSDALAAHARALGVEIETGRRVRSLDDLPPARAFLFDVSPREIVAIAGRRLGDRAVRRMRRVRYGPAAYKIDYALSGPVPWTAEACRAAGTVHLGASFAEIGSAMRAVHRGRPPGPPFCIAAQPSLFDPERAPDGRHVLWVYAHVPNGWRGEMATAIEHQIERFAPGFRDLVLARAVSDPAALEDRNPNYVGGDIGCGSCGGLRLLLRPTLAPAAMADPYGTGDPSIFLCSAATPPGPGVHGMCGYHAARAALRRVFGRRV